MTLLEYMVKCECPTTQWDWVNLLGDLAGPEAAPCDLHLLATILLADKSDWLEVTFAYTTSTLVKKGEGQFEIQDPLWDTRPPTLIRLEAQNCPSYQHILPKHWVKNQYATFPCYLVRPPHAA